jgi:hypothetical protein
VANLLARRADTLGAGVIAVPKASLDQVLAVLDEEVVDGAVADGGDLDELGETVADLSDGEGAEEGKVEERVQGRVVRTETVYQYLYSAPDLLPSTLQLRCKISNVPVL